MPIKYLRSAIIVTIQCIVPAMLLFLIAPQLIHHSGELNQSQIFFKAHQWMLLIAHSLFYLSLFFLWPLIINLTVSRQNNAPDTNQIKIALSAR